MPRAALISTLALLAGTTVAAAQVTGAPVSPSGIATCAALRWHNAGGGPVDRRRASTPLPAPGHVAVKPRGRASRSVQRG